MVTVRNTSNKARDLPGGPALPVGGSVEVSDIQFARAKENRNFAKWLAKGLVVEGDGSEASEVVEQAAEPDEADILVARLAEYGIVKTRRTSIENLRAALAEAEAGEVE